MSLVNVVTTIERGGNSFAPCDDNLGEHFLRELRTDLDELAARIAPA